MLTHCLPDLFQLLINMIKSGRINSCVELLIKFAMTGCDNMSEVDLLSIGSYTELPGGNIALPNGYSGVLAPILKVGFLLKVWSIMQVFIWQTNFFIWSLHDFTFRIFPPKIYWNSTRSRPSTGSKLLELSYEPLCPSIGLLVGLSDGPSVCLNLEKSGKFYLYASIGALLKVQGVLERVPVLNGYKSFLIYIRPCL